MLRHVSLLTFNTVSSIALKYHAHNPAPAVVCKYFCRYQDPRTHCVWGMFDSLHVQNRTLYCIYRKHCPSVSFMLALFLFYVGTTQPSKTRHFVCHARTWIVLTKLLQNRCAFILLPKYMAGHSWILCFNLWCLWAMEELDLPMTTTLWEKHAKFDIAVWKISCPGLGRAAQLGHSRWSNAPRRINTSCATQANLR